MTGENDDVSFDDGTEKQSQVGIQEDGVILDAAREVRGKLYLGQVHIKY